MLGGIGHNQDALAVALQRLDAVAGARYRCRADVQDAVSVQKEHVVIPGNVSQRFLCAGHACHRCVVPGAGAERPS